MQVVYNIRRGNYHHLSLHLPDNIPSKVLFNLIEEMKAMGYTIYSKNRSVGYGISFPKRKGVEQEILEVGMIIGKRLAEMLAAYNVNQL